MQEQTREIILQRLEAVPENYLEELLDFIEFLQFRKEKTETHFASQAVLARDWLTPKEDEMWQNL